MSYEDNVTCVLAAEEADRYLERVCELLRAARLNAQFPPVPRLIGYLTALHARTHDGLYPKLSVDADSGLPSYKEWLRVKLDAALAAGIATESADAAPAKDAAHAAFAGLPGTAQRMEQLYRARLRALNLLPLDSLRVELQRIEHDRGVIHARIVMDKLGDDDLYARCTVELSQRVPGLEAHQLLSLRGLDVAASAELRERMAELASLDAEYTLLQLAAVPGVTVHRVSRATIGPFYLAELPRTPPLGSLLSGRRGAIATFGLDLAARDLLTSGSNDPLPNLRREQMPVELRTEYEQARIRLDYRVFRDRKFVTDLATQPALEQLCRAAGTRNIIYIAAPNSPRLEVLA